MKNIGIGFLLLWSWTTFAQNSAAEDSLQIPFDRLLLKDVVVMDDWLKDHQPQQSPHSPQLEMQLKQLKGINLISRGSFAQEIVYRGQQDARLQVKLNGMRIYSACTDRMDPATSYVVANNLQSAEVTSACEAHCSNNGLAGNVNLQLKQAGFASEQPWRFGFSQQYHSNTRGIVSGLNVEHQKGNWAWRLNGTFQKHQNYRAGGGEEMQFSQNQKQNWALNTVYRLSGKEFLKLDLIYDLATDVGYPALPMDVSRARGIIGGLTYSSHKPLWKFQRYDLKLYHNDIYHEMDDTKRPDVYMHMDMPGWSRTSGLTLNTFDWKQGKHNFSAAVEYFTNFRRAEMTMYPPTSDEPAMFMLTWPDARVHGAGLGFSDHLHLGQNEFSANLRFDVETSRLKDDFGARQWTGMGYKLDEARSFVLPQLKLSWKRNIGKQLLLSASASYGQRGPSTSELFGFYLFNAHDGYDYLGNPDLEAEKLYSAEMSYHLAVDKFTASITAFTQQYRDYIFGVNTDYDAMTWGGRGVRMYENVSQAHFYGVEADAAYQFNGELKSFVKTSFMRGQLDDGSNVPLIPPLQGTLGANYSPGQWSFMAQTRLAADQPNYSRAYGDRFTPGYALINCSVGYVFKWEERELKLRVSATNLLDRNYRNHLNWGGIPSMGRNIVAELKLNL